MSRSRGQQKQRFNLENFNTNQNSLIRSIFMGARSYETKKFITMAQIVYNSIEDEDQRASIIDEMVSNFIEKQILAPDQRPAKFKDTDNTSELREFFERSLHESIEYPISPEAATSFYKDMAYVKAYDLFEKRVAYHKKIYSPGNSYKKELSETFKYGLHSEEGVEKRSELRRAAYLAYRPNEITEILYDDFTQFLTNEENKSAVIQVANKLDKQFQPKLQESTSISAGLCFKEFVTTPVVFGFAAGVARYTYDADESSSITTAAYTAASVCFLYSMKSAILGVPRTLDKRVNFGMLKREHQENLQERLSFKTHCTSRSISQPNKPVLVFHQPEIEAQEVEITTRPLSPATGEIPDEEPPVRRRAQHTKIEKKSDRKTGSANHVIEQSRSEPAIGPRINLESFGQVITECVPNHLERAFESALERPRRNLIKIPNGRNAFELKLFGRAERILCYQANGIIYADSYSQRGLHRGHTRNQEEIDRLDILAARKEREQQIDL